MNGISRLVIVLIPLLTLFGQDAPKQADLAVSPFPLEKRSASSRWQGTGPELDRLLALLGTWDAAEEWEKVPGISPGGKGTGLQVVAQGPGEMSVLFSYMSISGPFPDYRAHGIVSWEPQEKIYRGAWAQNIMPGVSVEAGQIGQDSNLVMSYEITEHDRKYIVRNVYSAMTPNSYVLTTFYVDKETGKPMKNLTIQFTKRSGSRP